MRRTLQSLAVATFAMLATGTADAAEPDNAKLKQAIKAIGAEVIRGVSFDLCYPADPEEYEALGKNAVIKLTAWSARPTELPLRSAYLEVRGAPVPLRRIAVFKVQQKSDRYDPSRTNTEQVSFYLLPLALLEDASSLEVDFQGERVAFDVAIYTNRSGIADAPTFIRLDEYKSPSAPDMAAVGALLQREYPDYFK